MAQYQKRGMWDSGYGATSGHDITGAGAHTMKLGSLWLSVSPRACLAARLAWKRALRLSSWMENSSGISTKASNVAFCRAKPRGVTKTCFDTHYHMITLPAMMMPLSSDISRNFTGIRSQAEPLTSNTVLHTSAPQGICLQLLDGDA